MGVREERFCDFINSKEKSPRKGLLCINPVSDTCFFCGRDFCKDHAGFEKYCLTMTLGSLDGWERRIPICNGCGPSHPLPRFLERRLEKLWAAIEAYARKPQRRTKGVKV